MEVMIINQQNKIDFTKDMENLIRRVINTAAQIGKLPQDSEVSVLLVDNTYIKELNYIYRGQNKPTDVLSFAMNESGEDEPDFDFGGDINVLGDIVVSLEQALLQSDDYGHSLERELGYLVAHGMLHLLGYDHETEEERQGMRELEEKIMQIEKLER